MREGAISSENTIPEQRLVEVRVRVHPG